MSTSRRRPTGRRGAKLSVEVRNRSAGQGGERALKGPRLERVAAALGAAAELAARRFGGDAGAFGRAVNVVWVRDAEMRRLGARLRRSRGTTDVLAWLAGWTDPETGLPCPAQIVCNLELARGASREHGNSIEAEAVLYAVHGLVHLLGGDDETPEGRRAMRDVEIAALSAAGLKVRGGEWDRGGRDTRSGP